MRVPRLIVVLLASVLADNHGTPLASKGKIRRYIDIGRLNKGR